MADKSREERNLGLDVGTTVREREEQSPPARGRGVASCVWRDCESVGSETRSHSAGSG
jgi:hypothetical protein